jgi:hypothetical protein
MLDIILIFVANANVINIFFPEIYKLSHWARVFVRIGWKSLQVPNTLAYYKYS